MLNTSIALPSPTCHPNLEEKSPFSLVAPAWEPHFATIGSSQIFVETKKKLFLDLQIGVSLSFSLMLGIVL
jgi:hypothetical protein